MIRVNVTGDYSKAFGWMEILLEVFKSGKLDVYGKMGVDALASATPKRTGLTAASWDYIIEHTGNGFSISWYNTNENQGENIALLIQYGHGLWQGGYVSGIDYINPAIQPVFDEIAEMAWQEVTRT